jgi:ubiquinone/menaquinone biosynthesis C-methylase UbiE
MELYSSVSEKVTTVASSFKSSVGTMGASLAESSVGSFASLRAMVVAYSRARSAVYQAEGLLGPLIDLIVHRRRPRLPTDNPDLFQAAQAALLQLLIDDAERIAQGVYPIEVLLPENPIRHLFRIPNMFREGLAIARRRDHRDAHHFSNEAQELLRGLPEYYQRNFHYQGDGYLSDRSADLYEHQVEVLFGGAADAMRRLVIEPLREKFGPGDGEGLVFLELGAGTGRATRFVRMAFPRAKIVAIDLSGPYLKKAQAELSRWTRHDFIEADAAQLPFLDQSFDAVYSVFLFHELPLSERAKVLVEAMRVLKPGGFHGLVDSIQKCDRPELDTALEQFPIEFHEPFYKNYTLHPMEKLLAEAGVVNIKSQIGFLSKSVTGLKSS